MSAGESLVLRKHEAAIICQQTRGFQYPMLLDGLVERGSVGMIVGPAKSKKSFFALNLSAAAATGGAFLGRVVGQHEKVLYVNLELTRSALGTRLNGMGREYPGLTRTRNLAFFTAEDFVGDGLLTNTKTQTINTEPFERLEAAAAQWGATVIVIDPLYFVVGEENDNVLVTLVLRRFALLRDRLGVTVFVVHHTRKENTDWSEPFLAGRGASSIAGFFEFVLGIQPDKSAAGAAVLHHGSRNLKTHLPMQIKFEEARLAWRSDFKDPRPGLDEILGERMEMPAAEFFGAARAAGLGGKNQVIELLDGSGLSLRRARRGVTSAVVRSGP